MNEVKDESWIPEKCLYHFGSLQNAWTDLVQSIRLLYYSVKSSEEELKEYGYWFSDSIPEKLSNDWDGLLRDVPVLLILQPKLHDCYLKTHVAGTVSLINLVVSLERYNDAVTHYNNVVQLYNDFVSEHVEVAESYGFEDHPLWQP